MDVRVVPFIVSAFQLGFAFLWVAICTCAFIVDELDLVLL